MGISTISALLIACAGMAQAPAFARPPGESEPTRGDGKVVPVSIGFYTLDFARITSREESFDLTGYLELKWRDPSVAPAASPGAGKVRARALDPKTIWVPKIFFENALEQPRFHNGPVVEVDSEGLITSWAILSGKFSAPMDLRRFPFDRQSLEVRIAAYEDTSDVRFAAGPEPVVVGEGVFLTDWEILRASSRIDERTYARDEASYSRFTYRVDVARRSTFYVWRVMLPLTLLALVSWAAFWFEPVGLQPQISTCMSALISLVAFNFAIDFSLPKVAYLTLIDRHALVAFAFVALSIAAVALIHVRVSKNRPEEALRIQSIVRRAYLPLYGLALLIGLTL